MNTKKVETIEDLYSLLDEYKGGDTVTLEILRKKKKEKIDIKLQ